MANIGQELLNVPFADMVLQLAKAIAEGQFKLDMTSMEICKMMGDTENYQIEIPDPTDDTRMVSTNLLGAGFQPTFYQFTDTIVEVKIAISITQSTEKSASASAKAGFGCFSASVNASYSSKYSYSAEGSSLLRTKITPVPPNQYLQNLLDIRVQRLQKALETQLASN